ncbi:MAG: diaminopropionate ammonia-lyase [Clostridia bacterium]|jgi:diaminopropionate ammonia-lyase|nr:diaminopropionate ammonia-lyase [Clostridia bacterium]MBT7122546.1 diaminopropionate ammonia-lyase [Clostridia bacterium]
MSYINFVQNKMKTGTPGGKTALFSAQQIAKVNAFHKSMGDKYNITPLHSLKGLADDMGIADIFLKDESQRGDLKAFKLLGGSYAVAQCLSGLLGKNLADLSFDYLKSPEVKSKLGDITFAAASDGNHGKSVAWAAKEFNQSAVVYMPKGTVPDRVRAIEALGANVIVTDTNYDGCVQMVYELCDLYDNWIAIADTSESEDELLPLYVMQGYSSMFVEILHQLNGTIPTHVFLQAGVGSFAAAMTACIANTYKGNLPKIFIMEPHQANCYYASGVAADGTAHSVTGDMDSIMAGLSCGVPNPVAWNIIKNFAEGFLSIDDIITANGMRILAAPLHTDPAVTAGESGAVGTGVLEYVMRADKGLQTALALESTSTVLLFSTEGDTDSQNYREVVWHGKFGE